MAYVKIEDLGEKTNPRMSLEISDVETVKGGATLEKLSDGKADGNSLKGSVKGFGSTTGDGPSTF